MTRALNDVWKASPCRTKRIYNPGPELAHPVPITDNQHRVMVIVAPARALENTAGKILEMLAALFVLLAVPGTAPAAGIQGTWLTEEGGAALTITGCGGQLCGRIVWLESAADRSGSVRLDQNNPGPAKRTQRICGLVVITGVRPTGPDTWVGHVHNPIDGRI